MKKFITISSFAITVFIIFALTGCVKDTCKKTYSYTWFQPLYKTTAEVRANIKSNAAKEIKAPGKLFIIGNYIFLNEINKGIHVINNANPAAPVNLSFIDIPGNIDIAVKGNILYADLYTDLVALDISNPLNVVKTKIVDNVFPERSYGFRADSNKIIFDWAKHDTTVEEECVQQARWFNGIGVIAPSADVNSSNKGFAGGFPTGIAGSMARFAIVNNYLYTVGNSALKVFDITAGASPVISNTVNLNGGIETIYPFKDRLFIGSNAGMFIYNVANPLSPVQSGIFTHARVCDPVIADDNYAFVTLRNGGQCSGILNELDVVDINNLNAPFLLKKYDLVNPFGLSKDGNLLFVCDGKAGLKIFDAANVDDIKLIKQISMSTCYDVIAYNGVAIVVAVDGLYQFDYRSTNNIHQLSKINISK